MVKLLKQALIILRKYLSTGKITSQRALGISEIKGSKLFDRGIEKYLSINNQNFG
jgi:hypothetical protein